MIGTEEFDSAFVRATEAAQRAAAEEKRRLIWFALVNGWVREKAAETRDRLLEIVDRYTLEDFKALDGLVGMAEGNADEWISVESDHHGFAMTDALKLDHGEANAYVQRFDADGLVMVYDQPELRKASNGPWIATRRSVLVRPLALELLEFIKQPT